MLKSWYFTTDKDGTENIWQILPIREGEYWICRYGNHMTLPYGSIYKITGLKRKWSDPALFYEQNKP